VNQGQYAGMIIGLMAFCVLKEWIFSLRKSRSRNANQPVNLPLLGAEGGPGATTTQRRRRDLIDRGFSTLLYMMNLFLAYILMLVVMSYNMGMILAIVAGSGMGYFLFQTSNGTYEEVQPECCEK